jgi:hypothetical protein
MNRPILALLFVCLVSGSALSTDYYISTSGNDTNSGTSPSTPWRSLTNIYFNQWGFNGGDSILLKAGDTFDGPIYLGKGGTSNAPITIDRYGTGANPIIRGDHPSITWTAVGGHTGMYSVFLGAVGTIVIGKVYDTNGNLYGHIGQGTNELEAWLSMFTNRCWGATTAGNTIYIRTIDDNPPPQMHVMDEVTVSTSGGYHIIQNLEVCNGGKGILVSGVGDIVRSNYVHDGYGTGIFLYYSSGTEVCSNVVTITGWTQIYLVFGGHNWIHHNDCSRSGGTNGIYIINGTCFIQNGENCGVGLQQGTNNIIEHNNLSYYQVGTFVDFYYEVDTDVRYNYGFHAGQAAAPMGTGLKMHHNIFNLNGLGSGISASYAYSEEESPAPDTGSVLIYNNVVYNYFGGGIYNRDTNAGVIVRNNIFVVENLGGFVNIFPYVSCDYNTYYVVSGSSGGWVYANTNVSTTLIQWQTISKQDSNSIYADPQFVSASPVNAADFQLKSSSPCINIGQNLKSVGLLGPTQEYKDFLGIVIPRGDGPDIGGYEFLFPSATAASSSVGTIKGP